MFVLAMSTNHGVVETTNHNHLFIQLVADCYVSTTFGVIKPYNLEIEDLINFREKIDIS